VAYSFYATKNMTTGEGGMVTTHDQELADRMKVLCLHGINKDAWNRYSDKGKWFYQVSQVGFKYNMSDIQSAIGIHQLRKQEEFISRRSEIAELYNDAFGQVPELEIPEAVAAGSRHCWHLYVLKLRLETLSVDRDEFFTRLKSRGVSCSVHFIPIPMHSAYQDRNDVDLRDSDQAMRHFTRILSLPLFPGMTRTEVDHVIESVLAVVNESRVAREALSAMAVGA
jgi:dTDP-4-amino-4,6-dideoxygalactose transaminase